MKLTFAFLAILLTLGFGACSSYKTGEKPVILGTCVPPDEGKVAILKENSFEPGGRVVRLAGH